MNILNELIESIEPAKIKALQELWNYLEDSEKLWMDNLDGKPKNFDLKGDMEHGALLYYLHNTPEITSSIASTARNLLAHPDKPASRLAKLPSPYVDGEGGIWGLRKYEQLDPFRELAASAVLVETMLLDRWHDFGSTPYAVQLEPTEDDVVRLGILGDWGTGNYNPGDGSAGPAAPLAKQVQAHIGEKGYLFHLGDVYYAGTGNAWINFPFEDEENANFLDLWPAVADKHAFTLNSNHEMYAGGDGYFDDALASPAFKHQNKTSYFGLQFGKWVILGLDSAYNAKVTNLFMEGALGEQQAEWIKQFGQSIGGYANRKVLVLTHHNGFDFKGEDTMALWDEVKDAIGRAPDAWYWGHIHNGIVYSDKAANGIGEYTKARCIGHSAMPFGKAGDLLKDSGECIETVTYFAHTPDQTDREYGFRVLNGYAVIELHADGGIKEYLYELNNSRPVWTSNQSS